MPLSDPKMPAFNSDQTGGVIRALIPTVVAYLAGAHILFDAGTWNIILTSVVTIGVAVWSYYNNSSGKTIG